ncbi:Rv3235 family protein [Streptomyces sp. 378]|uniref:Rv3235 family protein n=1 Tax=Streptomyces sp. 378 TaxID=3049412 RepID=UPI0024C23570|nr:Rv3235 family protein [Streptomyces sp. 378]MDK1347097.1 Rv3235 family protein [Streptomyces sp. 378]
MGHSTAPGTPPTTAPGTPDSAAPRTRTPADADAYATGPAPAAPGTTPPAPAGAAPPRSPGSGRTRPQAAGGRPPASARTRTSRTRPADTRPPTPFTARTAPRRATDTTTPARASVTAPAAPEAAPRVPVQGFRPAAVPQPRPTDLFADLLLAVLSGHRPVHSMLRHTRGRAYDELAWLAERGPLRTRGARPVVRDIGYFEPRPGAIEAFARIGAGDRLRAMAFRLELGQDLRWRCTAVELGGPRPPRPESD